MNIKALRDEMLLAEKLLKVKEQEFLIAEAKYNLKMAEIALKQKIDEMEQEKNGN